MITLEVEPRSQHNEFANTVPTEVWRVTSTMPEVKSRRLSTSNGRANQTVKLAWIATLILLLSPPTWAGGSHKRHSTAPTPTDPDYVFALATANRFLHAWQTGDLESGMVLLSDRVRHSQDPEKFEQFFSGNSDRAFELARGQGSGGRYRFSVVIVTIAGRRIRSRYSDIVVVNTGKNDWVVDKLP